MAGLRWFANATPRLSMGRGAAVLAFAFSMGCTPDPEQVLVGRWTEVEWRYEKLDPPGTGPAPWIDSITSPLHSERGLVRHEAEWWEFRPGGALVIHKEDGSLARASWRLKGRGHVLRLRAQGTEDDESYDIKELSDDELVLNYDVGMEVRGIARLRFRRVSPQPVAWATP